MIGSAIWEANSGLPPRRQLLYATFSISDRCSLPLVFACCVGAGFKPARVPPLGSFIPAAQDASQAPAQTAVLAGGRRLVRQEGGAEIPVGGAGPDFLQSLLR